MLPRKKRAIEMFFPWRCLTIDWDAGLKSAITEDLDEPLMRQWIVEHKVAPSPTCRPIPQMPGRKRI
jgi:hypothetical protein